MRVNARKRLFFQCSPFDELLVNIVSSFVYKSLLVFSGTVSSGESKYTLVSWRSMFSSLCLAFPGTVYSGVFQCASAGIVGSLPPRVQDSFDLSTVPRPAGYQCSGYLSSFSFPVKTAKTKDIANSKI